MCTTKPLTIQQPYDIAHVMADGTAGNTSAICELPPARRLMCWAYVIPERMLYDWSLASANTPFAIQTEFTDDLAVRAYQWLQKLDRTKVLHLGAASYVVPSSEQKMGTSL
ncbi:unnamed protein product [Didymodactylos carnosus]|uniref:Uncharacterized protein n=1 Tax=Didymodactylos carnosus TaxID=1234261 RepID=A0A8S2Z0M5_9BILA|nr:unnamed protein product [Didymodactylos carnosus]